MTNAVRKRFAKVPCAHCGNRRPKAISASRPDGSAQWKVQCRAARCPVFVETPWLPSKGEAIAAWNVRAKR